MKSLPRDFANRNAASPVLPYEHARVQNPHVVTIPLRSVQIPEALRTDEKLTAFDDFSPISLFEHSRARTQNASFRNYIIPERVRWDTTRTISLDNGSL